MRHSVALCWGMGIAVAFAASHAPAAIYSFTEDFSDNSPNPMMALGSPGGSPTTDFTGDFTVTSGANHRIYLGTHTTDYFSRDFVFSATVIDPGTNNPWSTAFFGMGSREPNPGFSLEPLFPNVLATIRPDADAFGNRDNGILTDPAGNIASPDGGTHRLRMTWNATTLQALLELDLNYTGIFTADYSQNVNGADNGFNASNSRLILGGGFGITFDDIVVQAVPEPSSVLLLGFGAILLLRRRARRN